MPTLLRRFSFLVYPLIFFLVISPVLWSPGLLAGTPSASSPIYPPKKVIVLEVSDGKVKRDFILKVTDTLRDELGQKGTFQVQSKEQTRKYLSTHPHIWDSAEASLSLNRYLEQAKGLYKEFAFEDAVHVLKNTIENYRKARPLSTENFLLTEAYLMLGNVYMGMKNSRKASEAFREAIRLDPQREITENNYPPKTVATFRETREEYLKKAKVSNLEINSTPGKAEVFVNGNPQGSTPVILPRMTLGEHFVLVRREGYKPQALRVEIKEKGFKEKISLEKDSRERPSSEGLAVTDLKDVGGQVRMAGALGKGMGVEKVVLVSVEEVGWNYKITARMVDVAFQASHKHKSVEVLDLKSDTRSAVKVIADDLSAQAHVNLAKDSKKYLESDTVVIGKKKKSFLKSPILWSLIGVLVAGGAASALLLAGGGGDGDSGSAINLNGSTGRAP